MFCKRLIVKACNGYCIIGHYFGSGYRASCGSVAFIAPQLGTTFLPQEKMNDYDVNFTMEKGTAPDITNDVANEVENILLEQDEVELVSTNVKGQYETASISFVIRILLKTWMILLKI